MLIRDFIIALRILRKQKAYAAINIVGLALGMACCLLILSFVSTELSYDRFHEKTDRIYRLTSNLTLGKTPNFIATTNVPPALAIKEEYPGVIAATRMRTLGKVPFKYKEEKEFFEDKIFYTEPSFFEIFTFPIIYGDPVTALARANSVVLTESTAEKYFGDMDPIGKVLRLNDQSNYTVTGVMEDVPKNSHFTFDVLLSFETLYQLQGRDQVESWSTPFSFYSYVLLEKGQDAQTLEDQFPELIDRNIGDSFKSFGASVKYFLQPVTDIHLHSNLRHEIGVHSDIKYVYIFTSVAAFVLLIACFNFMNLATARSATRAGEIGMRKILGARKGKLIRRFLLESIIYALLSIALAYILAQLVLPVFSELSDRELSLVNIPWLLPGSIGLAIIVGLLSGLYPAVFLSSFSPKRVLSTNQKSTTKSSSFRKVLVIVQFTISIIFIIGTHVVFKQLQYLKNKDLGFDKEQIVVVPLVHNQIRQLVEPIKERLMQHPSIVSVGTSSHVPSQRPSGGSYEPEGYNAGESVMMDGMSIDEDYLSTLGMEIVAGRNFSKDYPSDPENAILINETAAREIGWEDPLNKKIKQPGQAEGKTVIGVVKDFFFQSPHKAIRGIYISHQSRPYRALFVKIGTENIGETMDYLRTQWREFDPTRPLDYFFLDESYDAQYKAEERLSTIFTYFTVFVIIIACLGLYGMSSFTAEQRTKEIGIRKVLGASFWTILVLFYRWITKTIGIALLIAVPVAYFVMDKWLQGFEFRTPFGLAPFLLAGLLTLFIALATVSIQSADLARRDPVKSMREE